MKAGLQCPLWAGLLCEVLRPNFTTTPIIQHLPSLTPAVTYRRIGFARKHGVNSGWACELAPQPIVCACEIRLQTAGTAYQNPTQLSFLSQKRLHKENGDEMLRLMRFTEVQEFLGFWWGFGKEKHLWIWTKTHHSSWSSSNVYTNYETNTSHLKIGPKRKVPRLPTIHFQGF